MKYHTNPTIMNIPCIPDLPVQTKNRLLLKKIEELTLFLFDHQKENEEEDKLIHKLLPEQEQND